MVTSNAYANVVKDRPDRVLEGHIAADGTHGNAAQQIKDRIK
ncbi:MAG: hypothetical protein WAL66_00485 [Nitrososphaeraceae archaeon]